MNSNSFYYAVIFTSTQSEHVLDYEEMAEKMVNLARNQKGFIGIESARDTIGITISYWKNLKAIQDWKANYEHLLAQKLGREKWYESYKVRVCKVEREYEFKKNN